MSRTCQARTRSGDPCKNRALPGSQYCRVHQAAATAGATQSATAPAQVRGPDATRAAPLPGATDETGLHGPATRPTRPEEPRLAPGAAAASGCAPEGDALDPAVHHLLANELDNLMQRLRGVTRNFAAPPFSPNGLLQMLRENLERISPEMAGTVLNRVRTSLAEDLLNIETWKGIWFVLNYSVQMQAGWLKRRLLGEYQTDDWGLDWEFVEAVRPFFEFMYRTYWRVETTGLENVPEAGRGLLVSNHSGQLPWDGVMLGTAVLTQHPSGRLLRNLYASWFPTLPFFSTLFVKLGQALATVDNGTRLLEEDQLVGVYPEGYKGVGKLYRERYRLARFGRGGFVKMALNTGAPIIPVSVVGAEETYIALARSPAMARLIGFPYFPISLTFPWLGLLGFIPLPTKWYIDIGQPIPMGGYGANASENGVLVSQLADQVRNVVQQQIYVRLAQRRSIFFG